MIASDLPSTFPIMGTGPALAVAVTNSINEALADATGGKMQKLKTLLTAAIVYVDTGEDSTVPAISTRTQAFGVPVIVLTYGEGLDNTSVPPPSAFVISSPSRTVTGVEIVGATVRLSYSGATLVTADSPQVAYTQPSAPETRLLKDAGGNLAATFAAADVTVAAS